MAVFPGFDGLAGIGQLSAAIAAVLMFVLIQQERYSLHRDEDLDFVLALRQTREPVPSTTAISSVWLELVRSSRRADAAVFERAYIECGRSSFARHIPTPRSGQPALPAQSNDAGPGPTLPLVRCPCR